MISTGTLTLIILTATLGLLGALAYWLSPSAKKVQKRFQYLAQKHGLTINCSETFKWRMIGIDYTNLKVLYLRYSPIKVKTALIDLASVTNCTHRKLYLKSVIKSSHGEIKLVVSEVLLEFDNEDMTTVGVPFYHHWLDNYADKQVLEQKARHWEVLIQKLLVKQPTY